MTMKQLVLPDGTVYAWDQKEGGAVHFTPPPAALEDGTRVTSTLYLEAEEAAALLANALANGCTLRDPPTENPNE